MTEREFDLLRAFLKKRSGLDLGRERRYLAESRLRPVWREAGLPSLGALARALAGSRDPDLEQAVLEAMATHETMFFRDRRLFDALRTEVLPRLIRARSRVRRLRIWSAAASTGQEAYSLAMILADLEGLDGWSLEILATDISGSAIDRAKAGLYSQAEVQRGLPVRLLLRHFHQVPNGWTVSPAIRKLVRCRTQNLLDDLEPLGLFDVVLCRNVLIYLDHEAKADLLRRLSKTLAADGALCLGTAETALGLSDDLFADPAIPGVFMPRQVAPGRVRRYAAG